MDIEYRNQVGVGMNELKKPRLNWRTPVCGGLQIHGTSDCDWDLTLETYVCKCNPKPKNFDYVSSYLLAQAVFKEGLHLDCNGERWEAFTIKLFLDHPSFSKYAQVYSNNYRNDLETEIVNKTRYFGCMFSPRHSKIGS